MNKAERERERYLFDRSITENYVSGKFVSKKYSDKEIEEKRKYYEALPTPKGMEKGEWLGVIEREFERRKKFRLYPDASFYWLDYVIEFGL